MTEQGIKPRKSFGEVLAMTARFNPKGAAITCGGETISWGELNDRVNRIANALKDLGVKKGDHASILFHDCPEFIETNYALQKLGAVPIPVNFRFMAREIAYQLNNSDSNILIFEDLYLAEVTRALGETPRVARVVCLARQGRSTPEGMSDYLSLLRSGKALEPQPVTTEDDVCTICYTGGTTGLPKGVVLTYANFWNLARSLFPDLLGRLASDTKVNFGRIVARILPVPGMEKGLNRLMGFPKVRTLLSDTLPKVVSDTAGTAFGPILGRVTGSISLFMNMPLFHMANYQLLLIGPMSGLLRFILREGIHFEPGEVLATIEREKPMVILLVPTQWNMLLDFPDLERYDRRSLLVAMTGAGANPAHRKRQILEKFPNALVVDVFGQTEMTPDTALRIDASPETLKNKSVGKPLSGIETRIVDEAGNEVPPGQVGEIIYRSGTIMKGYYGEEQKTSEVIRDGWFHSGDLGYIDPDGEIIVVDRKNECISTGAEKVFPHEVEEILARHAKIDSACVIGVPDDTWGHAVKAVVVLKQGAQATEDEIILWCRDKMTGFKRPKQVVFAEALPLSPVGKVLRKQVKELYGGVQV
ncbi:MAG TPA: AMP-binding protein [Deltaproteobacteria bacterium]|nr:AMP-binding protein [Deltaproteobacteria bacterium]HPR56528.1 AMP-binding protein [Deltaproteobacteria bacterium]